MPFKRFLFSIAAAFLFAATPSFAKDGNYQVSSPDGHITASVTVGENISYTVSRDGQTLIAPSTISMNLSDDIVFGQNDKVRKTVRASFDETFPTVAYKKAEVRDNYNQILLNFKEFSLIFRAYDDGVAYRFVSNLDKKKTYEVISEQAEFNFGEDRQAFIPYVNSGAKTVEGQFFNSFENTYTVQNLSQWRKDRLAFLPLVVAADEGVKILITEADLTNYPGMHVIGTEGSNSLKGTFAPYPKVIEQGGHNKLQGMVKERENFIAKASGDEIFPWRVIMVSTSDSQLAVNDMVWKLSPKQDGCRHGLWLGEAGQGCLGLVERLEPLWSGFQSGHQ